MANFFLPETIFKAAWNFVDKWNCDRPLVLCGHRLQRNWFCFIYIDMLWFHEIYFLWKKSAFHIRIRKDLFQNIKKGWNCYRWNFCWTLIEKIAVKMIVVSFAFMPPMKVFFLNSIKSLETNFHEVLGLKTFPILLKVLAAVDILSQKVLKGSQTFLPKDHKK